MIILEIVFCYTGLCQELPEAKMEPTGDQTFQGNKLFTSFAANFYLDRKNIVILDFDIQGWVEHLMNCLFKTIL